MKEFFVSTIFVFLCCGGGSGEKSQAVPKLEEERVQVNKSVLMVIAPKNFRDEEFKEPYDLLTKSGMKVVIASTNTAQAKGMLGMVVRPEIKLEQVNPDSFDALVIVGGMGAQILWDNTTIHKIVRSFHSTKKVIGAICIAPVVLARAGILKDIKATAYSYTKHEIIKGGAVYTGSNVEISGNIITSSGPQASKDFADAILNSLTE